LPLITSESEALGLAAMGIKSSLEIVCFQVVPERVECIGWTDRVRKRIPKSGREFQFCCICKQIPTC